MPLRFSQDAPKRAVNLTLNRDLVQLGKDLGLNLSGVAEEALAYAVNARLAERWVEENRSAIGAYNRRVEAEGVFSDGLRSF